MDEMIATVGHMPTLVLGSNPRWNEAFDDLVLILFALTQQDLNAIVFWCEPC